MSSITYYFTDRDTLVHSALSIWADEIAAGRESVVWGQYSAKALLQNFFADRDTVLVYNELLIHAARADYISNLPKLVTNFLIDAVTAARGDQPCNLEAKDRLFVFNGRAIELAHCTADPTDYNERIRQIYLQVIEEIS